MTNYKDTLNLPKTDFPMKANLVQREPQILQHWEDIHLYELLQNAGKDRPTFILHDGPPYANGSIHLGTALNKVLKDIIIKAKTLSGFHAPYVPGWDCHGLPIEHKVEKNVGKAGEKLTVAEFRKSCRQYAASQVEIQKADFKRLGVIGDWERPYLTMDYHYEANVIRALAVMIKNGHLVRGRKPVHWCTACGSALAEAEVEYQEKSSPAIDVAFLAVNPREILEKFAIDLTVEQVIVPIWTTTPWTLPASEAVAVHPQMDYVLIACQWNNKPVIFIVAEALSAQLMHRYGIENYEVLKRCRGEELRGIQLKHPFLERLEPVVCAEHVTTDAGTGNVHTAPAHGLEDYAVGLQNHLPMENPVNAKSCFLEGTPLVAGLFVLKANDIIIVALADSGHLLYQEALKHSYPHCWRHKTPLIFLATPQWFIGMEQQGLRGAALKAIDHVKWVPSSGKARIHNMVANRPDWCISRQRSWGIPITLFFHKDTHELHPNTLSLMESVAQKVEQEGVEAWYQLDAQGLLGDDATHYVKCTDILDVWFDSGVSHACVLAKRPELHVPADLYLEGSDQHRGWFQSSLLTSLAMGDHSPYEQVLTHGYVVDGKGRKMSKSLGNVILPSDIVNKLGADVLRLWVASTDHTGDMTVSDEILSRASEAYRRIRNTARFLLSNLADFDPKRDSVNASLLLELDRWAIATTKALQEKIIQAYDRFHLPLIYQLIHNFCTVEMGSFYLDIIKDRQYTCYARSQARRSAQTAIYHILSAFVRWLAPISSFTAEEIWQHMPGNLQPSVFLTTWHDNFPSVKSEVGGDAYWQQLMQVRDVVNKVLEGHRIEGRIGSALEAQVYLYADDELYRQLAKLENELRFVLITSGAQVLPSQERDGAAQETSLADLWVKVEVSPHAKCERCWQRCEDVGGHAAHATLCGRCIGNITAQEEKRKFA